MRRLREWILRFGGLFNKQRRDRELDAEIESHLQLHIEDNLRLGMTPEEARRQAMIKLGGIESTKEACRDQRGLPVLETLWLDIRYGARMLRKNPAFTTVAVLTLALGIGANTTIFSLMDTVLLRSLPVQHPDELVFLQTAGTAGPSGAPPYPCFERFRNEISAFAGMAAFAADELRVEVDGVVEQVFGQVASGNFFRLLGVRPALGRLMTMEDEKLDPPVAVISHGYWKRRFGADPAVIGRILSFRDRVYTIVGVTSPAFRGLHPGRQVDLTLPITSEGSLLTDSGAWWFDVVARLLPHTSVRQATVQVDTIFQSFMQGSSRSADFRSQHFDHMELPGAYRGLDRLRSRFSGPLYALTAVAAIVLLIACANLGGLLLTRGAARAREFAVRLAAGASSSRLLRQVLTETLLLFLLGALAGWVVAYVATQKLAGFLAIGRNPILLNVQYDWRLVLFASAVTLAAGLFTGLWPALRALRTEPQTAMKEGEARSGISRRETTAGRFMVACQVALSLVSIAAAVMFLKTMQNLRAVDLGFSERQALTMSLDPAIPNDPSSAAREQFWKRVLERVRTLPGVRAASLSVLTPLSGRDVGKLVTVHGFQPQSEMDRVVHLNHVSEDYFETFGIQLLAGRSFAASDSTTSLKVAIVNEAAAKAFFAARNPIGETIGLGVSNVYQVIGIVRDQKHMSVREPAPRFAYVPLWQRVDGVSRITLAASFGQSHANLAHQITQEVRAIHANTLVSDVLAVSEQIDATLISERLLSVLASGFAVLALVLAAIGLYGILSYSVARRRVEFGVRMALGATPGLVMRGLFAETLVPLAVGMGIGLLAALAAAHAAQRLVFEVSPVNPGIYLISTAVLATVAGLAVWLPARRAAKVDPMVALRNE